MADSRYWSKEATTNFIEIYKTYPCLWKIKSRDYTNRNLKNQAYDKLIEFSKTIYPEANRDFVVKKIQSFRGSFRKEIKKIQDSKRSGAGADEIYSPTLWYYNLLLFTIDQELPTSSISNIGDDEEETGQFVEEEASQECESQKEVEDNNISQISTVVLPELPATPHQLPTKSPVHSKRSKTSKQNKAQLDFINYCKNQLEKKDEIDEFDAASISWAKKLKRMNPTQAIYADMLINRVINEGLLNQLTSTTVITDPQPTLIFSPFSPSVGSNSSASQQGPSQIQSSSNFTNYYQSASNEF